MHAPLDALDSSAERIEEKAVFKSRRCIALIGDAESVSAVKVSLRNLTSPGPVKVFFDRSQPVGTVRGRADGEDDVERLILAIRRGEIDRVIVAVPSWERERISQLLDSLEAMAVDIDLIVDGYPKSSRWSGRVEELPLVRVARKPMSAGQAFVKALFDKIVAACLVLLTGPLMLAIAAGVKLTSRGPVLFRQPRYGRNNEIFNVLKFRTLYSHCTDVNADRPVTRLDQRVTRLGRLLRALSLDELPQLFNVLRGEMSIVGPRPLAMSLKVQGKLCSDFARYAARHRVRPGITGLAQVKGWRGEMDVPEKLEKRLELDVAYVENYSLMLDLKIFFATVWAVLRPTNAY